jgi:hypothetical protein
MSVMYNNMSVLVVSYCTSSSSTLCTDFFVCFLHLNVILFKNIRKLFNSVILVQIYYALFPHLYLTVCYSSVCLTIFLFRIVKSTRKSFSSALQRRYIPLSPAFLMCP